MPWSKGAVVIKKYGVQEWADAIENAVKPPKREPMPQKRTAGEILTDILEAETKYGRNWAPPRQLRYVMEGFALIVYGISLFVERLSR